MSNLSIIQGDLNELKFLKTQCKRDGVKMILSNQIRLLEEKQRNMCISDNNRKNLDNSNSNNVNNSNLENMNKKTIQEIPIEAYTPITKYSWDQTDKYIKIYIDMIGIQEKTDCLDIKFGKDNIDMQIKNLNNKFYSFAVKLHDEVRIDECSYKTKKDMIVITLKKANSSSKWPRLSHKDGPLKKSNNIGEGIGGFGDMGNTGIKDPMAGIQDLMKKMYEEGDDEMKRTIAKAWTEAQSKNMKIP